MFSDGDRVGVAVSGGADSVALLHLLLELRDRWRLELSVIHVNHQLRGAESEEDAQFVAQLTFTHKLPFYLERAPIADPGNIEENARRLRLDFFDRLRRSGTLTKIATGHTASDQAETVLFRFLRGSSTTGLAGILPVTREGVVRPLLALQRSDVKAYLRRHGIGWREDSTNRSARFTRNRLRHELIPLIEREYQPALIDQLSHMAAIARDEDQFWEELTSRYVAEVARFGEQSAVFDCAKLMTVPPALARRLIRIAIRHVKGDLLRIDFEHVEALLTAMKSNVGSTRIQLPGVDAVRSFDWLRIAPGSRAAKKDGNAIALEVPSQVRLPGGGWLSLECRQADHPSALTGDRLDPDRTGPLTLRGWRSGDAYRPLGKDRTVKLKQMFQDARIPVWERSNWPVIEGPYGILWSRKFGPSAAHQPESATGRVLVVRESTEERSEM